MQLADYIDTYFSHLSLITTAVGFLAFVISYAIHRTADSIMRAFCRAATWCALPNGIAFLICSAYPAYVPKIADVGVAFFMGGMALVAVALYDIASPAKTHQA